MILTTDNGIKILSGTDGTKSVYLASSRIDECLDYARFNEIDRLILSRYHGWEMVSIAPIIDQLKDFNRLNIVDLEDYSSVHALGHLKELSVQDNKVSELDLSFFPHLEFGNFTDSKRLLNLNYLSCIKSLNINGYKSSDLSLVSNLTSLDTLSLIQARKLNSFSGIRELELKSLSIYSAPKLADISEVRYLSKSLGLLELELCKSLENYEPIGALSNLKTLRISNSASMPNLKFVKGLTAMEFFSFVETKVLDGDLNPLFDQNLKYVGFDDKRHYSHKMKEFNTNEE